MARVEKYSSILKRGVGSYVKQLSANEYLVVANEKTADNSFVVMRASDFAKLNGMAGYAGDKEAIETALRDIKEKNSETYRKVRSLRKS